MTIVKMENRRLMGMVFFNELLLTDDSDSSSDEEVIVRGPLSKLKIVAK
jgi:hypothetical protein